MGNHTVSNQFSGLGAASAYGRNIGIKHVNCCTFALDYILCSGRNGGGGRNRGNISRDSIPDDQQYSGSRIYAWMWIRRRRTYDSVRCCSEAGNDRILELV